jgi:hypothetical protein
MDPDEALTEVRELIEKIATTIDGEMPFNETDLENTDRLIELVKGIDERVMSYSSLPDDWTERCEGGLLARAKLAQRVSEEARAATESFEGDLGMQLAYLFGAILENQRMTLDLSVVEEAEVFGFFTTMFPLEHPVWAYIQAKNGFVPPS